MNEVMPGTVIGYDRPGGVTAHVAGHNEVGTSVYFPDGGPAAAGPMGPPPGRERRYSGDKDLLLLFT